MGSAHYAAFRALFPPGTAVHDGSAEEIESDADYPYVVLGGNAGRSSSDSASGEPDALEIRFKVTYAALSFASILHLIGPIRDRIIPARLIVEGWEAGLVRHEELLDIQTDFDVTIPGISTHPVFAVDEFSVFFTR